MPTTRTVSLPVPATASVGDTLTFVVQGTELEVVVPEGTEPGHVLQLELMHEEQPPPSDNEEEPDSSSDQLAAAAAASNENHDTAVKDEKNIDQITQGSMVDALEEEDVEGQEDPQRLVESATEAENEGWPTKTSHFPSSSSSSCAWERIPLSNGKVMELTFSLPSASSSPSDSSRSNSCAATTTRTRQDPKRRSHENKSLSCSDASSNPPPCNTTNRSTTDDGTYGMLWPSTRLVLQAATTAADTATDESSGHNGKHQSSSGRQVDLVWSWILGHDDDDDDKRRSDTVMTPFHHVLELGSGVGGLGMALAASTQAIAASHPLQVTLTDCEAALPLLQYNVQHNIRNHLFDNNGDASSLTRTSRITTDSTTPTTTFAATTTTTSPLSIPSDVRVDCQTLDWATNPPSSLYNQCDLIVTSDILYNPTSIPALVETVGRLWKRDSKAATLLWIVRWRKPDLERDFFQRTRDELQVEWTLVSTPKFPCPLDWTQVGDPNCPASNQYFGQDIQLSLHHDLYVLADITPEMVEQMTNHQHDAWERAHIQVYRGVPKRRHEPSGTRPQSTISARKRSSANIQPESSSNTQKTYKTS